MPPSCREGSAVAAGAAASERCRPWIASNREIRASIASTRVRSISEAERAATCRSLSRTGARFHDSAGPVTASDSWRSISANSSPDTAPPPALTATGVIGVAGSKTLVPIGSQPAKSRRAEGMNPSGWGGAAGNPVAGPTREASAGVPASVTACATATLASLIAATASLIDAVLFSVAAADAATAAAGGTTPGGVSRSASHAQRNSPAGGSIRTHRPVWRPAVTRTSSITCTRSPASRLSCATCRRSLICDPTRDTAPSVTMTPMPRPAAGAVAVSPPTATTASTSQARNQLKLPSTGRTAT